MNPRSLLRAAAGSPVHADRGRPSVIEAAGLREEHIVRMRALYARTNRTREDGSMVEACRLFAAEPDCPPAFRAWLEAAQRADPHRLPPSLREALAPARPAIAWLRAPGRTGLERGVHTHGVLRRHETADRRLYAGEVEVWDDGSVNFVCWVPWPWGGCRVSDRWGVKVGRFQLLAAVDAASHFCAGFSFVARASQSYRGEDVAAAMVRLWGQHGRPDGVLLERATWESRRVAQVCAAAGVEERHTHTPRHKLIEPWFGRVWLRTSAAERVSLGRFRRDDEEGTRLHERLKSGSVDPRLHCQSLPELVEVLERAIARANAEPVASRVYGTWVPAERWEADRCARGEAWRRPLGRDLAWTHAPEQREWTVRRGHVAGVCEHPGLGVRVPWAFAWPEAWRCEGRRVLVCFDPCADPCRAVIVAREPIPEAGAEAGAVLCEAAECVTDVPALAAGTVDWDGGGIARSRELAKAQRAARAVEFRALRPDGTRAAWASEVRSPAGEQAAVAVSTGTVTRPLDVETRAREGTATAVERAAALERRLEATDWGQVERDLEAFSLGIQ